MGWPSYYWMSFCRSTCLNRRIKLIVFSLVDWFCSRTEKSPPANAKLLKFPGSCKWWTLTFFSRKFCSSCSTMWVSTTLAPSFQVTNLMPVSLRIVYLLHVFCASYSKLVSWLLLCGLLSLLVMPKVKAVAYLAYHLGLLSFFHASVVLGQ